jgi:predicted nucleic acid-binding protein
VTLIDTSAWIEFFRRKGNPAVKARVGELIAGKQAAYTCPISFELIAGARKEELADLRTGLDLANRIILLPQHWDLAGTLAAAMNTKGIRIPASDVLIAIVATHGKLPVLTTDAHFTLLKTQFLPDLLLV